MSDLGHCWTRYGKRVTFFIAPSARSYSAHPLFLFVFFHMNSYFGQSITLRYQYQCSLCICSPLVLVFSICLTLLHCSSPTCKQVVQSPPNSKAAFSTCVLVCDKIITLIKLLRTITDIFYIHNPYTISIHVSQLFLFLPYCIMVH